MLKINIFRKIGTSFCLFTFLLISKNYCFGENNYSKKLINQIDNRFKRIDNLIWNHIIYENPDSAISLAKEQLNIARKTSKGLYFAKTYNTLGTCYYLKDDFYNANKYYSKSLIEYKKNNDLNGEAVVLNNLGNISKEQGNFAKAIDYYTTSLRIDEKLNNQSEIASCLNNIGILYANENEYKLAINYYKRSVIIRRKIKDFKGLASPMNNLGNIYEYQKQYYKAIKYYRISYELEKKFNNKLGELTSLINIASVYKQIGDVDLKNSMKLYQKSEDLTKDVINSLKHLGNNNLTGFSYINLASIDLKQKQIDNSIKNGEIALKIAKLTGSVKYIKESSEILFIAYRENKDFEKSLLMHELFVQMNDSIYSSENQDEIIRQEYKYKYDKQVEADSLIQAKEKEITQVQLKQEKTKKIALISGLVLMLIFLVFIYNRYKVTLKQKEIISKKEQETNRQKGLLETKNKEITDSINYAKRIQAAILPAPKIVKEYLKDSFVLYIPRDIVAGDFYWMEQIENGLIFAAADCTGHGVPGAMVSVLCNNALNRSVREYKLKDPGKILNKTREIIIHEFDKSEDNVSDGMDVSLCTLLFNDTDTEHLHPYQLKWAGANNPLWIIRNNDLIEFKPDKQPVGKYYDNKPFTSHTIEIQKGDCIYTFTDGYKDQFGGLNNGDSGKKLKANRMKELLIHISNLPMEQQKQKLEDFFYEWKGDLEQVDDVCIIGVRID
jgi:tetratricopeptide (TPR) repeat protein/serine phosphatase RsbU (regulator of sigma subunit)